MLIFAGGCGREPVRSESKSSPAHRHVSPHGGTAVVLGDEAYHLEFVREAEAGVLRAYVMDGHLENFVRVSAASFDVAVRFAGREELLQFKAVSNPATGETAGDTAMFEAGAPWAKTNDVFDAVIRELNVRRTRFTNVAFHFPEGNEIPTR